MTVYYVTIFLVILLAGLAQRYQKMATDFNGGDKRPLATVICLVLCGGVLVFVAGFRYGVGADFNAYYKANEIFGGHAWHSIKTLNEPVIALFTDFVSLFTRHGAAYIFFFSLFSVGIATYIVFRDTEHYIFAILLYIFCGCWHGTFNGVRQYIAATWILIGYRYIYEKKFWKYAFFVFLAYCSHVTAIIMIVPYFLLRNRITFWNILLLTVGTVLVSANYDTIFSFVGMLKEEEIVMNAYATNSVNVLRILVNCAPAIFTLILYLRDKERKPLDAFYVNILIINAAAMVAASNSAYLARIGIYTNIFTPIALDRLIKLNNKRTEWFLRTGIILLFAVYWYIEMSGSPALNRFFWTWNV